MGERKSRWRTWTWRAALAIALACAAASALVIGIREGLARESLRGWVEEYASMALGAVSCPSSSCATSSS